MALRQNSELPVHRVVQQPLLLLYEQLARIGAPRSEVVYRRCTDLVGRWIRQIGLGSATALAGYVRNIDPKLCRFARRRGLKVICDQMIAPARIENREVQLQANRFPGWETPQIQYSVPTLERETWAECDQLTAASEYVRAGLIEEGVTPEKISVLPYPVAANWFAPVARHDRTVPLTVGFIGSVNLRKGAPYFFRTAQSLTASDFRFLMAGPVHMNSKAMSANKGHVELIGGVPRKEVARLLDSFDVFYFPSTCEGSAGSVMEAMMAGLPVICSPNTGSVVRDGIDGFLVNYDDTERAAELLTRLARDRDLRVSMGRAARERAASFSIDSYSRMWLSVLTKSSSDDAGIA